MAVLDVIYKTYGEKLRSSSVDWADCFSVSARSPLRPSSSPLRFFVHRSGKRGLQIESISDGKRPGNVSNDRIGAARTG